MSACSSTEQPHVETTELGVAITGPSGEREWVTLDEHVTLQGVAFGSVERVSWETDDGRGGDAVLDGDVWSIPELPLDVGKATTVTVKALRDGEEVSDVLSIRRNEEFGFLDAPYVQTPAVFTQREERVHVSIELRTRSGNMPETLRLERVDDRGKSTALTQLADHGVLSEGDEIEGDGVYSGYVTFQEAQQGLIRARAVGSARGKEEVSAERWIYAVPEISDAEMQTITLAQEEAAAVYDDAIESGAKPKKAAEAAKASLVVRQDVREVTIAESGYALWVLFTNGLTGAINRAPKGTKGASTPRACVGEPRAAHEPVACVDSALELGTPTLPGRFRALMVSPYENNFPETEHPRLRNLLDEATCPQYQHDGVYENEKVTFDLMRTMSRYGLISIDTHGDSFVNFKYDTDIEAAFVVKADKKEDHKNTRTLTWLQTGGGVDDRAKDDIQKAMRTGAVAITAGKSILALSEIFFRDWIKPLPGSLVYLSHCRSARTGDTVRRLLKKGAHTVLGYTNYVGVTFARQQGERFFNCLFGYGSDPDELPSTRSCYKYARENDKDPAEFVIFPQNHNMRLIGRTHFLNGDFEHGARYWDTAGDARFVSRFGAARPTSGEKMALISTGLGFSKGQGVIKQPLCLQTSNAQKLKFRYKVYSAEFKSFCNNQGFQDTFRVVIKTGSKTWILPLPQNSSDKAGFQIQDLCKLTLQPSDVPIPHVKGSSGRNEDEDGTFMTGWQAVEFDIAEMVKGSPTTLSFEVRDQGDSQYDTAVLIDDIELVY